MFQCHLGRCLIRSTAQSLDSWVHRINSYFTIHMLQMIQPIWYHATYASLGLKYLIEWQWMMSMKLVSRNKLSERAASMDQSNVAEPSSKVRISKNKRMTSLLYIPSNKMFLVLGLNLRHFKRNWSYMFWWFEQKICVN